MIGWIVSLLLTIAAVYFGYRYYDRRADAAFDPHVPNQLIVKFREGVTEEQRKRILQDERCESLGSNTDLGVYAIGSKRKMRRMLKRYMAMEAVEYAEPNYTFKASFVPNDPYFSAYQYGPQIIKAPEAWEVTASDPDVMIAVVDTGVQLDHPDLAAKVTAGYDFVSNDRWPNDGNGHGTHVAGIAAAATNNGIGIAGVAPRASIMPVRVLDDAGNGSLYAVANGIVFAANQGAQVINLSLGSPASATTLRNAVQYAIDRGAVVVAAAGNEATYVPSYPAYYPNVIAVASTNSQDLRSAFSNYGRWVEVAAPGEDILSAYPGGYYAYLSGTSMASPHVAGIAALLVAQGRTNRQVRQAILATADPIRGTGVYWAYGRVNANRAVRYGR
jgi:thermitase